MKASTENCKQFQDEEEMPDAKVKAIEALVDVHVQVIFLFTEEPYELFQCSLKEDVAPVLNHILKFCAAAANWSKATKLLKHQMEVIRREIKDLVDKKAMRMISRKEACSKPGFYSKMFCSAKPAGGWRPVINLKPLNKFVSKKNLRLETLRNVRAALQPSMWASTIDLSDAYYHIRWC